MVEHAPEDEFVLLQREFARHYRPTRDGALAKGTAVLVPSITFPSDELKKIVGIQHYEERLLCYVLALADPDLEMIFVTSLPVDPAVVDYYIGFLDDPASARRRLHLESANDPAIEALTSKVLRVPGLLARIRALVADPCAAYLLTFNSTPLERRLAEQLGIPLFGPDPALAPLGSKSGARRIAVAAGVPLLDGEGDLHSVDEVADAIERLRKRRPELDAVVVKLNNGFSGQGNAIIRTRDIVLPLPSSPTTFCADEESWESYGPKIVDEGAVVEELVRGPGTVSPSVQMRISPRGETEVISTHDQILGGPDDQVYLGCRFPARADYREVIQRHARAIAEILAVEGVIGSFGMDFIVVDRGPGAGIYLSEINLRMGGTTHPFAMARLAGGGRYDEASGELRLAGRARGYVATDNLKDPRYVGLTPSRVINALTSRGLAFDRTEGRGAMLHLLGTLTGFGKLGVTCVADDADAGEDLYAAVVTMLDDVAAEGRPKPDDSGTIQASRRPRH